MDRLGRFLLCLVLFSASVSGCKKGPPPEPERPQIARRPLREVPRPKLPTIDESMSPEHIRLTKKFAAGYEQDLLKWEIEKKDRSEMVLGAPVDFKPAGEGRKAKLELIPRSKFLRKGQPFWYRLELTNIGDTEFNVIQMSQSFFKVGRVLERDIKFFVKGPDGIETEMLRRWDLHLSHGIVKLQPVPGLEGLTPKQKELAVRRFFAFRDWERKLSITLWPGETLVSKPWSDAAADRGEIPAGTFRELWTEFVFDKPGTYRIKAAYENPKPKPPTEDQIQEWINRGFTRKEKNRYEEEYAKRFLGTITSNEVALEVVP